MSEIVKLKFPFILMTMAGMWLPDSFKSKRVKILYLSYQYLIGVTNTVIAVCEIIFVIVGIVSKLPVKVYNDTLFVSISGTICLIKFLVTVIYKNRKIFILRNFLNQKTFNSVDELEIKLERNYEKFIR